MNEKNLDFLYLAQYLEEGGSLGATLCTDSCLLHLEIRI